MPPEEIAELTLAIYPDARLRKQCARVEEVTDEHIAVAVRMQEILDEVGGLGLAANQVGFPVQMVVSRRLDGSGDYDTYFNPKLVRQDDVHTVKEFCLSLPGITARVKRANVVMVEVMREDGSLGNIEAQGIEAQMWQHELEHLAGELMTDNVEKVYKSGVETKLKQLTRKKKREGKPKHKRPPKRKRGKRKRK
jgi:peptide deformylase